MPILRDGSILLTPATTPAEIADAVSKGMNKKKVIRSQHNEFFLLKTPGELNVNDVFQNYLPQSKISVDSAQLNYHLANLRLEEAFLEILIPRMAAKMFAGVLVVPETYLHIELGHNIWIISKFLKNFDEFLSHKPCIKERSLFYDDHLPTRADLELSEEEAYLLGQLYAVALVFNLWDLFNSNLLNSGFIREEDGKNKAAIVDFGYAAHISYKGRHTDTLALSDPNFFPKKKISYSFFGKNYREHYTHSYALPMDRVVGPLFPHLVVSDLFDMHADDEISRTMLSGFTEAIETALKNVEANPSLLREAMEQAFLAISVDSIVQANVLKGSLNPDFYSSSDSRQHNLLDILQGRLLSAAELIPQFAQGVSALSIQEEVRDFYYDSQLGNTF